MELAILGGNPVITDNLAKWPDYDEADLDRLREVLEQRQWGGIPFPNTYAAKCAKLVERSMRVKHALPVTNGSDALVIALKALGIRPGDEVITTGYTWVASAGAILLCNAVPVLADVQRNTGCIDAVKIQEAITPKTKAVIVVHIANQVCDMEAIMKAANDNELFVIEDCAHAPYAQWEERQVGTIGQIGTFSFECSKIMTCGEGGMVITNSDELYEKSMAIANCGRKPKTEEEFFGECLGWNCRMTELQAAVLYGQLLHINDRMAQLQKMAAYLFAGLRQVSKCLRPFMEENEKITRRQMYCILLEYVGSDVPLSLFCAAVRAEGGELEDRWYLPLHQSPLFYVTAKEWPFIRQRYGEKIDRDSAKLPICEELAYQKLVWLHYPAFCGSFAQIDRLLACITKVEKNISQLMSLSGRKNQ